MSVKKRLVLHWLVGVLMITSMLFVFGCTTPTPEEPEAKTLDIGVVAWLGFPVGLGMVNSLEVLADMDNEAGGLQIGEDKYQINFIVYDTNNNQNTAEAAINKLVFEDKVDFIIADPFIVDPWLSIPEENGVVVCAQSLTPGVLNPENNYTFQCAFTSCGTAEYFGWLHDNYPEIITLACAWPDDLAGHSWADGMVPNIEACGLNVTNLFYPSDAVDLSALGTQVKELNPDAFMTVADIGLKASRDAGYTGQLIYPATASLASLLALMPAESLEGLIGLAWPTEFDPALTTTAQNFKEAYIAEYGEWDGPEIQGVGNWACLRTALQKAGSIDPDDVAAVIANGLAFDGPNGSAMMVSRPDLGNDRTVDCIVGYAIKQVVNGELTVLDTITLEQAVVYFQRIYHD